MIFRTAEESDFENIIELYKSAVKHMRSNGLDQWDELYPDESILKEDIDKGDMCVLAHEGRILAAAVINGEQDEGYADAVWGYNDKGIAVIHRLCVNPEMEGGGIGRAVLKYSEGRAADNGCCAVRLDVFSKNERAIRLYERAGYERRGSTLFRKGKFYLYEKTFVL